MQGGGEGQRGRWEGDRAGARARSCEGTCCLHLLTWASWLLLVCTRWLLLAWLSVRRRGEGRPLFNRPRVCVDTSQVVGVHEGAEVSQEHGEAAGGCVMEAQHPHRTLDPRRCKPPGANTH